MKRIFSVKPPVVKPIAPPSNLNRSNFGRQTRKQELASKQRPLVSQFIFPGWFAHGTLDRF
jgi:hypothetical protein